MKQVPQPDQDKEQSKTIRFSVPDPKDVHPKPVVLPTENTPAGFCTQDVRPGSQGQVEVRGFHAFDEGLAFYRMLGAFDPYLRQIGLRPSQVENMLVVTSKEETRVYINDNLPMLARMRVKRSVGAGEPVVSDDIAAVDRVDFGNIKPTDPSGFLLLVSVGWRRGICFDYRPLLVKTPVSTEEAFDGVKQMAGMLLSHLLFTERFLLSPRDWDMVIAAGWFPFLFLPDDLWQGLVTAIRNRWDLSVDEEKIHGKWLASCDDRLTAWRSNRYFAEHVDFLERAIRAYKEADWLTVVCAAAPRVEGLLRKAFGIWGKLPTVISKLAESTAQQEHPKSLLFPHRLAEYFRQVFFRFIDFSTKDLPSTRHTLAHGLVGADKLTRKEALTLLLLLDHVLYCLPLDDGAKPKSPV